MGATIHKPGHFISLRKSDGEWYMCNDHRVTKLSRNGKLDFDNDTYIFANKRLPLRLISTHGTMIVYDKIIDL